MPSHGSLDAIADAHDPLLGADWIALGLYAPIALHWRVASARALPRRACLSCAYGLMSIDDATRASAAVGCDYGTRTAVTAAPVVTLAVIDRRAGLLALATSAACVPLMLVQRSHRVMHTGATTLMVGPLCIPPAVPLRDAARLRSTFDAPPVPAPAGRTG